MEETKKPKATHKRTKSKANKFIINTKDARGQLTLLQHVAELNPHIGFTIAEGKGKLMWYGTRPHDDEPLINLKNKIVNRIMGLEAGKKRDLGLALNLMAKYFPEDFRFFPKTYTMPEDLPELEQDMATKTKYFITKPTSGAQGEGITLINQFRELNMTSKRIEDIVVQEYLASPLLLYGKKWDLRLYVVVLQMNPMIAFVWDEGLARFCTEAYQTPTNANISKGFMHLTNYSLNKRSADFVYTDELYAPNEASKQTLTSLWAALENDGVDVGRIKENMNLLLAKTLVAVEACLDNETFANLERSRANGNKNFHIIGVDVLIDSNLDAWLIEINVNPSLNVDEEHEVSPGVYQNSLSILDQHIKTFAVQDAIALARKSHPENCEREGSYYRLRPGIVDESQYLGLFQQMRSVFQRVHAVRNPKTIQPGAFLAMFRKLQTASINMRGMVQIDFDTIYKKACKIHDCAVMDFLTWITAVEMLTEKLGLESPREILSILEGVL